MDHAARIEAQLRMADDQDESDDSDDQDTDDSEGDGE